MKHFKKITLLLVALISFHATAHDFEVDGIFYEVTDDTSNTVAVTYKGNSNEAYSNEYSGRVSIPELVTYSGTTYSVTFIGNSAFMAAPA